MKVLSLMLVLVMTVSASAALVNVAPDANKSTRYGYDPTTLGDQLVDGDTATGSVWFATPAGGLSMQWSEAVTIQQIKFYHATSWACHSTAIIVYDGALPDGGNRGASIVTQLYGSGGWGSSDAGALLDLTFAPVTILPTQFLSIYSWGTGAWSKIEEIEILAVPEPVTMSLLALGGIAGLVRRRRG